MYFFRNATCSLHLENIKWWLFGAETIIIYLNKTIDWRIDYDIRK